MLATGASAAGGAAELADATADAAGSIGGDEVAGEAQLLGTSFEHQRILAGDLGADLLHFEGLLDLCEERRHALGRPRRAEVALPFAQHLVRSAEADGAVDECAAADRAARH